MMKKTKHLKKMLHAVQNFLNLCYGPCPFMNTFPFNMAHLFAYSLGNHSGFIIM